ncbi:MAG: hypothetical protein PHC64_02965 [Candidatus Gastranaerophilales bacterium]|nr:hypothetical protein [Candidatus Gastranaerophilales bacterium]
MKSEGINKNLKQIIFYIVFFLFILAFSTMASNYDFDFWARLIIGQYFVQVGHVPFQDFLSYTPTHACFDHEWAPGVIFYLVYKFFSSPGFLFLQAILTFLIFFFMTKIIELRGVKTTSAYNFLFYYFAFIAFRYIVDMPVRCQMFSFIFFTVFLYLLERERKGVGGKYDLFIYPPIIMVFWYNLHGGCTIGLGLIVLYIIGEFLNKKPVKKYIFSLLACFLVYPINPWGFKYMKLLVIDSWNSRPMISEWQGLFSKFTPKECSKFTVLASILILTELGVIIKRLISKTFDFDKTKFLIVAATLFFAIKHIKLIPFAVISMTCFFYDDFYTAFNTLTRNFFNKIAIFKDTFIYLIILLFAFSTIYMKGFGPYLDFLRFPVRAVEFIKINNLKGNILQDFNFGSYISYKLYPHNKIFIDGRYTSVYGRSMLPMIGYFHTGMKGWKKVLEIFPPDIILLGKTEPVYLLLKNDKFWKVAFEDKSFIVFVKTKDFKNKYKQPSDDINYYQKRLFDTDIDFKDKKWKKKELKN